LIHVSKSFYNNTSRVFMTENEFTYWAFLSHSQQDNCEQRPDAGNLCWGDWLRDALKTFSVPADFAGQINARGEIISQRINPVFQDTEEQPKNASLSESVRQALAQSKCLVVICSPRSAKSLHVNEAVRYFKQLGRGNRILPIVIAGEPNASDGNKPGLSPADECFVPALRYPVKPDGTLDPTRRERGSIFADARQGDDKREIKDHESGEIELETAKIQLIAGLIGVGFNGLWGHELKRRFAEAKILAREARQQIQVAPNPALEAQKVLEAQKLTSEAQRQIQELRNQALEAQSKILEAQNQAREAQGQVAEARNQAQAAENRVLEAQQLARESQSQLEAARHQVREAQNQVLEIQNLPQDVKSQIQEAQTKAHEAQSQIEEARNQALKAQSEVEAARNEARDAQKKFLEAQSQVREAQSKVQEIENQARQTQSQLDEARSQAQVAESKVLEAQQQAREAQNQVAEARNQAREAQVKIQEIQNQTRDAQSQIQAAQTKALEAQNQARLTETQVQELQNKTQAARRLTKVFAVMAVLALMAAGNALWQRKVASQVQAKATTMEVKAPDLASGALSQEQLLDSWMKTNVPAAFDWSCQLTNADFRQRALEKIIPALAADALTNTLTRLNDLKPAPGEQSYTLLFQNWAAKDPVQAIEQRQQIPGRDADGKILSAILTVWTDQQPEAALRWLEAQPDSEALSAGIWRNNIIADLFSGWAAKDLEAATTACQQLPDGTAKEKAWERVLSQRIAKAPASAAEPVKNLPPGDYRQKAIAELCNRWIGTNAPAVLDWAQSLTSEAERVAVTNHVIVNWAHNDSPGAAQFASQHSELSGAVFGEIANAWFQRDFAATTNWVASLPDGEKKDAARLALVEIWAQTDPKSMATYALGLSAGDVQTRYLTAACRQLAIRDFPATVELLQPLTDASLRQTILEQAARTCDLAHINQTAKFIAAMPASDDQKAAIKGLVSSWTPADPETAFNWLNSFPATNAQPELVQSVIKAWSQPEPAVVAKWLATLPAGTASEGMVSAFLEGAVAKYPEYAAQWTQSVTDETQRQKYQLQVARQWLKTDSSVAAKWIESLSLPEEIRQSLKAPLP
jgi:uncharacterized coiled-coil DUF342 family protein